jgi:hypothetical protein
MFCAHELSASPADAASVTHYKLKLPTASFSQPIRLSLPQFVSRALLSVVYGASVIPALAISLREPLETRDS